MSTGFRHGLSFPKMQLKVGISEIWFDPGNLIAWEFDGNAAQLTLEISFIVRGATSIQKLFKINEYHGNIRLDCITAAPANGYAKYQNTYKITLSIIATESERPELIRFTDSLLRNQYNSY